MSKIIIYPNNCVEVDGITVNWTNADFEQHGISIIRIGSSTPSDECSKFTRDGNEYVVFYSARKNNQLIRIRKKCNNPFKQLIVRRSHD
jgi:hypothetical protein